MSGGENRSMREFYLLVAGLLTGFAVPTSTLDHLSTIPEEGYKLLSDFKEQTASAAGNKTIPTVETSLTSETSNQVLPTSGTSLTTNTQPASSRLISGPQLYYERVAALKSGQIYTRVADATLDSLYLSAQKRNLTYDDWKNLLILEGKAMSQGQGGNRLSVMVGDSLSMWFPKEKLPNGKLWLNQGISGDTSTGVLRRLVAFSDTKPEVIYVMAGINDLRRGASDAAILRNHRQIIRRLRRTHPQARIIVQSILPTRLPTIPNNRIKTLNNQIARIAQQEGANFLNIHVWFVDFAGNLREDLTTDGLHLSQAGYDVWRWALQQVEVRIAASRVEPTPQVTQTPATTTGATTTPTLAPLPGLKPKPAVAPVPAAPAPAATPTPEIMPMPISR